MQNLTWKWNNLFIFLVHFKRDVFTKFLEILRDMLHLPNLNPVEINPSHFTKYQVCKYLHLLLQWQKIFNLKNTWLKNEQTDLCWVFEQQQDLEEGHIVPVSSVSVQSHVLSQFFDARLSRKRHGRNTTSRRLFSYSSPQVCRSERAANFEHSASRLRQQWLFCNFFQYLYIYL